MHVKKILSALATACLTAALSGAAGADEAAVRNSVAKLLRDVQPDSVQPSPVPGLYEVVIGARLYYVSDNGRYLIQGNVIDTETRENITEAKQAEAKKAVMAKVSEDSMVIFAPEKYQHTITVFTDIDCGYCRRFHQEIEQINDLGIEVHYLFFPRSGPNQGAWRKAEAVWCAKDRRAALTAAKNGENVESKACDTSAVAAQYQLGEQVGLRGTPGVFTSSGQYIGGYLAPAVFGFKDMELQQKFPFSPEKAKAKLAELGWKDSDGDGILDKDGQKLTVKFLGTKGRYPMDAEICEAVQAMWKNIGVDAILEFFEWAATFSMIRKPQLDYNVYCLGWVTTNRDADYTLYAQFHSSQMIPTGWNTNRYRNPTVDELLDKARSSQDREERKALYAQIQDTLAESAAWIPIYNTKEIMVINNKVKGFEPDPLEYLLPLQSVWMEK